MAKVAALEPRPPGDIDPAGVLAAIQDAIVVVDVDGAIAFANPGAEQFFDASAAVLGAHSLRDMLPGDSPIFHLIRQAQANRSSVAETDVTLESPRLGVRFVAINVSPLGDDPDLCVVTLREQTIARRIDQQLTHRNAARSVTAMAAILAHEVKNPLSGIRGAAQLLEQNASDADRQLTRLICDEADRIVALVNSMEVFSDERPLERAAVNIHQVLDHVRDLARSGFARQVRFHEDYDPSLPAVFGNRDQLIQVFLNLIKNAAEALPEEGGEIALSTGYQHGVRLAVPGSERRVHLPLAITVRDNGGGIPDDLHRHLFDPFVTTKPKGTGLGLALVAKIVGNHGGVIDVQSQPRRTEFRVMLPMAPDDRGGR